ncbi:hypothetical protein, partial [Pseudomonas syringae group genomosp. 7]|uniref:hypothetical protein n=1 Tax=Pseudomonas syringae group genomosp. 7 TaxID=251699 RepID=UPI00376F5DFE
FGLCWLVGCLVLVVFLLCGLCCGLLCWWGGGVLGCCVLSFCGVVVGFGVFVLCCCWVFCFGWCGVCVG